MCEDGKPCMPMGATSEIFNAAAGLAGVLSDAAGDALHKHASEWFDIDPENPEEVTEKRAIEIADSLAKTSLLSGCMHLASMIVNIEKMGEQGPGVDLVEEVLQAIPVLTAFARDQRNQRDAAGRELIDALEEAIKGASELFDKPAKGNA